MLVFNYNLKPQVRFCLENLICLGVIPGPLQPKDIGSSLRPFIDELEDLARGVPAYDTLRNHPFCVHTYLLDCFGDMPTVAKLMYMKGHDGKYPCRACRIRGVRNPSPNPGEDNKTNYIPLSRPFSTGHHEPWQLDPLDLPRRTHQQFILQAQQVESALTDAEEDRCSRHFSINTLSPLARLSSLDFPTSFPHDFMHAMFENVIPTLIDLWTHGGKYSSYSSGFENYILNADVWQAIGSVCAESSTTIPSVFGCRIPNLAKEHSQTTSESMLLFATLLAPGLLRQQFKSRTYYVHFIELVRLINLCLDLQLPRHDIQTIREGFAKWVTDYKRYVPEQFSHIHQHFANDLPKVVL